MTEDSPKVFISYSWSSPEHEDWVLSVSTELRESGVDVILDKWDLKEGHDAIAFMEKMVTDPEVEKVVLICDSVYAEKADRREGGVGTEAQIISPEIYKKTDQEKFVAIVAERDEDGHPYVPTYYKSRIFIDLSDQEQYSQGFEQLLRWIYGQPLHVKPELGKKPTYLDDAETIRLGTAATFKRALDALKTSKPYTEGALTEYFDTFVSGLELLRLTAVGENFDEKVIESIEQFLPHRNEAITIFQVLAQYADDSMIALQLHRMFENLLPYLRSEWGEGMESDNYRFVVHELFLYAIACLLKYEKFETVGHLLNDGYYSEPNQYESKLVSFSELYQYIRSLNIRNNRLNLKRLSLRADILKERAVNPVIRFQEMMQADLVLFVRNGLDSNKENRHIGHRWVPETLLYAMRRESPFELFARAQSRRYFERILPIFSITGKSELDELVEYYRIHPQALIHREWGPISVEALTGYQNLASAP